MPTDDTHELMGYIGGDDDTPECRDCHQPWPCDAYKLRTRPAPLDAAFEVEARVRGVSVDRVRADAGLETVVSKDDDTRLSDREVETIYAAFAEQTGFEAKTIEGKRAIVTPLYKAVVQARVETAREVREGADHAD